MAASDIRKKASRSGNTFRYFLLHKPYGILSQFSTEIEGKKTLKDVYDFPKDVYPVGRLDEDSEGLLLLTNDPSVNARFTGESVSKEYHVQVECIPQEEALESLRRGVRISLKQGPWQTKPAKVKMLVPQPGYPERVPPVRFRKSIPTTWISVTLTEGKNRQVRKMTAAVGHPTLRLIRVRIGDFSLEGMQAGEVREIRI